jgi:hypothetical protein
MRARAYLAVGLVIFLVGTCAWAQSRGTGVRVSSGQSIQGRAAAARSSPFRAQPPTRLSFTRRFHFRSGFSPFMFPGYSSFGYPYYPMGYNCDTRFSSPPYNCLPLYPQGPGSSDPYPAESERGTQASVGPPEATEPAPLSSDGAASRERTDPRNVLLILDGREQASSSMGQPLEIGSGYHTLSISAKPAAP